MILNISSRQQQYEMLSLSLLDLLWVLVSVVAAAWLGGFVGSLVGRKAARLH